MKRIFGDYAYGNGPRDRCWWDETVSSPEWPVCTRPLSVDVAIVGAGYTGLSAALHLAETGLSVVVLDAQSPGWGASGRNGGFCCLGGAALWGDALTKAFGDDCARGYRQAEFDAITLVDRLLKRHEIDADTHSNGETVLAHRPRDMDDLRKDAAQISAQFDVAPTLHSTSDLAALGMNGAFHGGMTIPIGFGLNPLKYAIGLARAAQDAGAQIFGHSPVTAITGDDGKHILQTPQTQVQAMFTLVATNGYSSEDVPKWMAGRFMPAQSTVMVTNPLSNDDLAAQGWTSDQMAYDTRSLLHYFRLMPDRRFLFGMRGGLTSSPKAEARARNRVRRDFDRMFPAWSHIKADHFWSGFVCLAANRVPYVGPVEGSKTLLASMAYHGNGVAMATYCGKLLSDMVQGADTRPKVMTKPAGKFPLGRARRALMAPAYAALALGDT